MKRVGGQKVPECPRESKRLQGRIRTLQNGGRVTAGPKGEVCPWCVLLSVKGNKSSHSPGSSSTAATREQGAVSLTEYTGDPDACDPRLSGRRPLSSTQWQQWQEGGTLLTEVLGPLIGDSEQEQGDTGGGEQRSGRHKKAMTMTTGPLCKLEVRWGNAEKRGLEERGDRRAQDAH